MGPRRSSATPDRETVARRAYELYESRGREHGRDLDDWLAAEDEVLGKASRARKPARTTASTRRTKAR